MKANTRFLYTVWRNSDDRLMILDGTADECAQAMNIQRGTFYIYLSRGCGEWTIVKKSICEIQADINAENVD